MTTYYPPKPRREIAGSTRFLPSSLSELEALLAEADDPDTITLIRARIENRRHRNRKHAAQFRARMAARSPEEVARDQADIFPDGHQTCADCGRRLPLSAFEPNPRTRSGLWTYCRPCRAAFTAAHG